MRKIVFSQVAVFLVLLAVVLCLGIGTAVIGASTLSLGAYHAIAVVAGALVLIYVYALIVYRLFLKVMPLREGEIPEGSQQEFVYHIYLLFYLILFHPIIRSGFVPVPIMRVFYQALGAKLGPNTYSSGIIFDPPFVEIGANTIVGQYALIIPHIIEGKRLAHHRIRIGNDATIGGGAIVLTDVTIGDNAIVSTGAVVTKGTSIGANEVWGGVPARLIGHRESSIGTRPGNALSL